MTSDDDGRLAARLRRLETQIGAFRDLHTRELGEAADRLAAIAKLQADELQMILDELADIATAAEAAAAPPAADASGDAATATDPAAASPKRARWLAEQERRSHVSRRDLFRPRS